MDNEFGDTNKELFNVSSTFQKYIADSNDPLKVSKPAPRTTTTSNVRVQLERTGRCFWKLCEWTLVSQKKDSFWHHAAFLSGQRFYNFWIGSNFFRKISTGVVLTIYTVSAPQALFFADSDRELYRVTKSRRHKNVRRLLGERWFSEARHELFSKRLII